MKGLQKSLEGIPAKEYRWGTLLLSLLPGFLIAVVFRLLALTVREKKTVGSVDYPANSLIVVFHPEFLVCLAARKFWIERCKHMAYLGSHTFASYVTSVICWLDRLPAIRYDRKKPGRPIDQVREYLRANTQTPFAFRTDSGGPYYRVRPSAAGLSATTNRPVVCMRQVVDRAWVVNQHYIPMPFSTVTTYVGDPIPASDLAALSNEEATALIQREMEALVPAVRRASSELAVKSLLVAK
ncbi:hypothetical protein K2X33_16335 [bacterium]|nr:hypothetical protein [bacterium]